MTAPLFKPPVVSRDSWQAPIATTARRSSADRIRLLGTLDDHAPITLCRHSDPCRSDCRPERCDLPRHQRDCPRSSCLRRRHGLRRHRRPRRYDASAVLRRKHASPGAYSGLAVLPDGTVLCFYESGDPQAPRKNGRPWAYSFLTVARFHPDWLTSAHSTRHRGPGDFQPPTEGQLNKKSLICQDVVAVLGVAVLGFVQGCGSWTCPDTVRSDSCWHRHPRRLPARA